MVLQASALVDLSLHQMGEGESAIWPDLQKIAINTNYPTTEKSLS